MNWFAPGGLARGGSARRMAAKCYGAGTGKADEWWWTISHLPCSGA
jgi:hypothetical protein